MEFPLICMSRCFGLRTIVDICVFCYHWFPCNINLSDKEGPFYQMQEGSSNILATKTQGFLWRWAACALVWATQCLRRLYKLSPGTALCHGLCCPQSPPPSPPPPLSSPFPSPSSSSSSPICCPVSDCPSACDPEARGHKLEAPRQQEGGDGGGGEEQVHGRPGQCLQSYQVSFESTKEVKNIYCLHHKTMRCTFPFSRWFSNWAVNHLRVNFNGGENDDYFWISPDRICLIHSYVLDLFLVFKASEAKVFRGRWKLFKKLFM